MPFTLAHGAAALPFRRLHLVPSALLIGTFAPDFEYFLRLAPRGRYGHTPVGALVFTLPLALLVFWLFHAFVKEPAAKLLPAGVQRRLTKNMCEFRFGGLRRFLLIVASSLLGIATHIVWDSFTHRSPWLDRHWPILNRAMKVPVLGWIPYYRVLQHSSTVIGLAALGAWFWWWYRNTVLSETAPADQGSMGLRLSIIGGMMTVAILGAFVRAKVGSEVAVHHLVSIQFIGEFVVTAIAAAWWQLVAYGMVVSRAGRG